MKRAINSFGFVLRMFSLGRACALFFLAISFPAISYAVATGGQVTEFLSYGAGARSLAMGGAFVSIADDATATYWNPAGMSQITRKEITPASGDPLRRNQIQFRSAFGKG